MKRAIGNLKIDFASLKRAMARLNPFPVNYEPEPSKQIKRKVSSKKMDRYRRLRRRKNKIAAMSRRRNRAA
jgi:hypothetical protein